LGLESWGLGLAGVAVQIMEWVSSLVLVLVLVLEPRTEVCRLDLFLGGLGVFA